jgi:hypothetical protein
MIAYPGYHGLPEDEPAKLILENKYLFSEKKTDVFDVKIIKDLN